MSPIEDVLQELGSPRRPVNPAVAEFIATWTSRKSEQEAKHRDDYDRGFAAGLAEGQRQAQADRVAMEQLFVARSSEELTAARQAWARQEGEAIGKSIGEQLDTLNEHVTTLIADVLEPILAARVRRACHDELIRAVRAAIDMRGTAHAVIRAREDVARALAASLAAEGIAHEIVPSDRDDVVITVDETTIAAAVRNMLPHVEETIR